MLPVIEIKGNDNPLVSVRLNRSGQYLNEHSWMLENEYSDKFDRNTSTECFSLWISVKIPVLVNEIEFYGSNDKSCELSVYKQENGEYIRCFQKGSEKSDVLENIGLVLEPGIYVFEISGCFPFSTSKGYLTKLPVSHNLFFAIIDGADASLDKLDNQQPYQYCMGGISRISYSYRMIDTYLGLQTNYLDSEVLVPGAWYYLTDRKSLSTVFWTGSENLTT